MKPDSPAPSDDAEPAQRKALAVRIRLHRFIILAAYAVIAAVSSAVAVTFGQAHTYWGDFLTRLPLQHWTWMIVISVGLAALAAFPSCRLYPLRSSHLRLDYPPLWIGVIAGIGLLPGFIFLIQKYVLAARADNTPVLTDWIVAVLLLLLIVILWSWGIRTLDDLSERMLLETASGEHPIRSAAEDEYRFDRVGKRLAHGLRQQRYRSIGLIGGYGSGKTGITNLIRENVEKIRHQAEFAQYPELWFSHTTCWGFADSKSAIHEILDAAIREVDDRADTLGVRSLPDSYISAVTASSSWIEQLWSLFSRHQSPESRLAGLSPILTALNARLVIIVEDLDRNQSQDFDRQAVLAMLQRIKDIPSLSFVLTGGRESTGDSLAFTKLCDHVEPMPTLPLVDVAKSLLAAREAASKAYGDVDPTPDPRRSDFGQLLRWDGPSLIPKYDSIERRLLMLLRTPRNLKHTIERSADLWESLHGEVDFDELLCVSALHVAAPSALDFIIRNIDDFRKTASRIESQDRSDGAINAPWYDRWQEVVPKADFDVDSVTTIIDYLLPGMVTSKIARSYGSPGPQALCRVKPTDYFRRIMEGEVPADELTDQEVLRLIEEARKGGSLTTLADKMVSSFAFIAKWEQFADRFPRDRLLELISLTLKEAVTPALFKRQPGSEAWLVPLRATYRCKPMPADQYVDWMWREMEKALPKNIGLANSIYDQFALGEPRLIEWDQREYCRDRLRERVYAWCKEHWPKLTPAEFAKAVDGPAGSRGWELCQLMFPGSSRGFKVKHSERSDWAWAGPLIQAAAVACPDIMIRQVANLVFKQVQFTVGPVDGKSLRALFGENGRNVVKWIADNSHRLPPVEGMDGKVVDDLAERWLLHGDEPEDGKATDPVTDNQDGTAPPSDS
ncbi:hypothetical protein Pan44_35520 [Caulifigura coniformis]|uniref:KAP NTPase domain-containing protein n=1 Tax=Caulifigura coniformis TaxID=2527983 RepID=A0A517SH98_9PLAN|nr:P-loop NTPase fold protein [Caulifigura coniformis]QDT55508.1 hypothetical protein Pan44_35520 [Caulifigura coniformis]